VDCLHCGDCCLRMSPLSAPEPCPHIMQYEDFYFCKIYKNRPVECQTHEFQCRFCPIGLEKLKLKSLDAIRQRIDEGYEKTKKL
jgi:hypothetical protein